MSHRTVTAGASVKLAFGALRHVVVLGVDAFLVEGQDRDVFAVPKTEGEKNLENAALVVRVPHERERDTRDPLLVQGRHKRV